MNIFIDTNIYLSFYTFTKDDLEELNKLVVLMKNKEVCLLLPEQVILEFRRNRENRINEALKSLKKFKPDINFPNFSKYYKQFSEMMEILKIFEKYHSELMKEVDKDIFDKKLQADNIINSIFENASIIKLTSEILNNARLRKEIGNPPSNKNESIGDSIIWESILSCIPVGEDICFLTNNTTDFASILNGDLFNSFLLEEWNEKNKSNLSYYRYLSVFS